MDCYENEEEAKKCSKLKIQKLRELVSLKEHRFYNLIVSLKTVDDHLILM